MTEPLYTRITGNVSNQILITKGGDYSGSINNMTIVNENNSNTLTVTLDLYDGTDIKAVLHKQLVIPPGMTIVLDQSYIRFNSKKYSLRITTTGSADSTIIIK